MKKMAVLFLALILIFPAARAEDIPISSLSTDELISLRDRINDELSLRLKDGTSAIYSGDYVVGQDIKAGQYILYFTKCAEAYGYGEIVIYANAAAREKRERSIQHPRKNVETYLNLRDGMILEIRLGSGVLQSIQTPSWTP